MRKPVHGQIRLGADVKGVQEKYTNFCLKRLITMTKINFDKVVLYGAYGFLEIHLGIFCRGIRIFSQTRLKALLVQIILTTYSFHKIRIRLSRRQQEDQDTVPSSSHESGRRDRNLYRERNVTDITFVFVGYGISPCDAAILQPMCPHPFSVPRTVLLCRPSWNAI